MNKRSMSLGIVAMLVVSGLNLAIILSQDHAEALDYHMRSKLSDADATFIPNETWNLAGNSVSNAGDVNGDGYEDFLIGAPWNSTGGWGRGQAYLILGKETGWAQGNFLGKSDASFFGSSGYDYAGQSVAGVGDVNGDGYDDILIGAPYNSTKFTYSGQAYLVFGQASGWKIGKDLRDSDASFIGESQYSEAGYSVAKAGDVNGDGYFDFLIGAAYEGSMGWGTGKVYLVLGKASGWKMDTSLSEVDASFIGEHSGTYSGWSVSGAGDVDGDGFDDFLIGAPYYNSGSGATGNTYLIRGKASGWSANTSLSQSDASFIGTVNEMSGNAVAGAGDVNGDGYNDFMIGSPYFNQDGWGQGKAYLIFGSSIGWNLNTSLSNASASFIGEGQYNNFGASLSGAGDVNGDGFDDILIGAPGNNSAGMYSGQTYLVLGKATGWSKDTNISSADASFMGEDQMDQSGRSVTSAGDVNGDGYDDIIIGAPYWNTSNGWSTGKVYLIFPDHNSGPASIKTVKIFTDSSYSVETSVAHVGQTVFIEVQGIDANAGRRDLTTVNVSNDKGPSVGINIGLIETDVNSGIYHGSVTIKDRTHEDKGWIKASPENTVDVSVVKDPSKKASVTIIDGVTIDPLVDNGTAFEDVLYEAYYKATGVPNLIWNFETNATWLEWDGTAPSISAIPDNGDVGTYWVRINVTDGFSKSAEHNFTLTVANAPPAIMTTDIIDAIEGLSYRVDYNSSDDGQGNITWQLDSNASDWLSIDPLTGVLNGTPLNEHVGKHRVNVSVNDGNGGVAWSDFVLNVKNTNNRPTITAIGTAEAYEDSLFQLELDAQDMDEDNVLNWFMMTNAGDWLAMDPLTGNLSGTPTNDNVGTWYVNATVKDNLLAADSLNFTLVVHNTNDVPVITSEPVTEANTNSRYIYKVEAVDVDAQDVLSYYLDTRPNGMDIDKNTGQIDWTPPVGLEGVKRVVIRVTDGSSNAIQAFNLNVSVNAPPLITSVPSLRGYIGLEYSYQVEVEDPDGGTVELKVPTCPTGMMFENKELKWHPDTIGDFPVVVMVVDEKGASYAQSWIITVRKIPVFSVLISSPRHLESVWDSLRIGGTSYVKNGEVLAVEVKFGDSNWTMANGTLAWYLDLNISQVKQGDIEISARATDGFLYSDVTTIVITVKRPAQVEDDLISNMRNDLEEADQNNPCLLMAVIFLLGAVVLAAWRRLTKRPMVYRPPDTKDDEEQVDLIEEPIQDPENADIVENEIEDIDPSKNVRSRCPLCGTAVKAGETQCLLCGTDIEEE